MVSTRRRATLLRRFVGVAVLLLIGLVSSSLAQDATTSEVAAATDERKKDGDSSDSKDDVPVQDGKWAPVGKLDVAAYLGVWYQTYASASVAYTFELGGNCVTATYYPTKYKNTIRVLNQVRPFADGGGKDAVSDDEYWATGDDDDKYADDKYADKEKEDEKKKNEKGGSFWDDIVEDCSILNVNGYAVQSNETAGALTVTLQPGPIPFGIGTPSIDDVYYHPPGNYWIMELGPKQYDQYQWAIVSNEKKTDLYVLVRNVPVFEELYETEVLLKIKGYGGFDGFTNRPRKTNQKGCNYANEELHHYPEDWEKDDDDLVIH